jgi:glutamine amidotransferase
VKHKVTIVDYGMGNLWSVASALHYLGAECDFSKDPRSIAQADILLLPGVGSFRKAMQVLASTGIADAVREAVTVRRRKILGICLGMQLFAESSTEDGPSDGLGLIPGRIERFPAAELGGLKVPHIGFNWVSSMNESALFAGLEGGGDFYFVHSYRLKHEGQPGCAGICRYGEDFVAAYTSENVHATQFHPEKSQTNGLRLLTNFLAK